MRTLEISWFIAMCVRQTLRQRPLWQVPRDGRGNSSLSFSEPAFEPASQILAPLGMPVVRGTTITRRCVKEKWTGKSANQLGRHGDGDALFRRWGCGSHRRLLEGTDQLAAT